MNKLQQSRKEKSTACFYDAEYWDDYWKKNFSLDPNNQQSKDEALKRINYVKKTYPSIKRVLDVGCGLGFFVAMARKNDYDAIGVDLSEPALERAPKEIKKFLRLGSITELPFGDNSFGLVTCFDVFEHLYIEEILAGIKEVSRVADKYILVRSPITNWHGEQYITDFSYKDIDKSHVSVYPWDFWARQFAEAGEFILWKAELWYTPGADFTEAWINFKRRE